MGALAGALLRQLVQIDANADSAVVKRLGASAADILIAAAEADLHRATEQRSGNAVRIDHVKKYMLENLHDADLGVERIAKGCGISPRTLNRVFVAEGSTPMRWLWKQRLAASYKALAEGLSGQVTEIALNFGFSDPSHFSRSFKRASDIAALVAATLTSFRLFAGPLS